MPMIGGTTSWVGPLIGAVLLGTLQQVATVTISSAINLLLVGVLLVVFVIIAPNGIIGLVRPLLVKMGWIWPRPSSRSKASANASAVSSRSTEST